MSVKESLHCHPVRARLNEYGIDNPAQMDLTILVYLNLCEVRGWWNVRTHCCQELNIFFLSGQSSQSSPREIILPISSTASWSPADIQQYLHIIKVDDSPTKGLLKYMTESCDATCLAVLGWILMNLGFDRWQSFFPNIIEVMGGNCLILAVCDTDSTMVFYKVTDGLVPPESPEESEQKKEKHSKKMQVRRNHLSHQTQIYLETNVETE